MRRRTHSLRRRRYGRAGHPLLPRLVMRLEKLNVGISEPAFIFTIKGELQSHYGGPWKKVSYSEYNTVKHAREALRREGAIIAGRHGVPSSHVEYVT